MVTQDEFNERVKRAFAGDDTPLADEDVGNWVAATFGKLLTGTQVTCEDLPATCPVCEKKADDIAKRRRNTAYQDDRLNWMISCLACFVRDTEIMDEMWAEYYSMVCRRR